MLRADGHIVHAPDLYEAHVFTTINEGVAHAEEIGFGTLLERGRRAASALPEAMVYVGFSLGVMLAQMLAQTRRGALGAILVHACVPIYEFEPEWPATLAIEIHAMQAEDLFVNSGDLDAAQKLVEMTSAAKLFSYPGNEHLFADASLPSYDEEATILLTRRIAVFLSEL